MTHKMTEAKMRLLLPTFPKRMSSAALILENELGQVIIEKATYKPYWTFPGGLVDPGESPKQTAVREVLEELGLIIQPDTVEFVAIVSRTSDAAETYQFLFRAMVSSGVLDHVVREESEIEAWSVTTKDKVIAADRVYAKAVMHWAEGRSGYIEQTFGKGE